MKARSQILGKNKRLMQLNLGISVHERETCYEVKNITVLSIGMCTSRNVD